MYHFSLIVCCTGERGTHQGQLWAQDTNLCLLSAGSSSASPEHQGKHLACFLALSQSAGESGFYRFSFPCPKVGSVTAPMRLRQPVTFTWQFAIPLGHPGAFTNLNICALSINRNISFDLSRIVVAAT